MSLPRDKTFENESKRKETKRDDAYLTWQISANVFVPIIIHFSSLLFSFLSLVFIIIIIIIVVVIIDDIVICNSTKFSSSSPVSFYFIRRSFEEEQIFDSTNDSLFFSFSQFIKFVFLCLWIDEKQIKILFFSFIDRLEFLFFERFHRSFVSL